MATKNPFTKARESRSWSFYESSQHMAGVSEQQIRNLEGVGATRDTDPSHIRISTALEICRVYYPDVDLSDFHSRTPFRITPIGPPERRSLKGHHCEGD